MEYLFARDPGPVGSRMGGEGGVPSESFKTSLAWVGEWDGALGPASPGLRGLALGHWGPFGGPERNGSSTSLHPSLPQTQGLGRGPKGQTQGWNRGLAQGLALNCLFPFHHWALEPEPHGSPTSWSVGSRLCLLLPLSKARPGTQAQLVAASQRAWGSGPAGGS